MKSARRIAIGAAAVIAAFLLTVVLARHALVRVIAERALSAATGYTVTFHDQAIGWSHAALLGVHVTKGGERVLDAERIDVEYALRDIFPGGKHRYGFAALAVARPVITIVRHADGSYNLNGGNTSATPPSETKRATAPLFFTARVRDGTIRLIDAAPGERDLAEQTVTGVAVDASVQSDARTVARLDGTYLGRRSQSASIAAYRLHERTVIDYPHGYATHRFRAAALPLRGLLNYLVHSPAVRFNDGLISNANVAMYAVNISPGHPFVYRMGGGGDLSDADITVAALAKPVRDLRGHLDVFDDGVTTKRLDGTLAGAPLVARGGIYDFSDVRFRLGVAGDTDLRAFRHAFAFLDQQPVRGALHLESLITATAANPFIHTTLSSDEVVYATVPVRHVAAAVDYYDNVASFGRVQAAYGPLHAHAAGTVAIGERDATLQAYVAVTGSAAALPYAQQLIAGQNIDGAGIVRGTGKGGYRIRATVAGRSARSQSDGFIAVDEAGRGEFGPFFLQRNDGSSLIGALRLERPISSSGGWIDARRYRVDIPAHAAVLPGVALPDFPAIGGVVDGTVVAAGSPSAFAIAGHVHASDARYAAYALGTVDSGVAGSLDELALRDISVEGPLGHFSGDGAVANGTFALAGRYDGRLEALRPFTGDIGARGALHAPVSALASTNGVVVQTSGAVIGNGNVRGVALERAAGTLRISGPDVRVIAADTVLGGTRAVAVGGIGHDVAVSAVGVPATAIRNAGVPLESGRISFFGIGNLRDTRFKGTVDLTNGRASGYPVGGWADVDLDGTTLALRDGVAALGTTYARLGGRLDDVGKPNLHYAVDARVALGDVASLAHDLRLPVRYAEGSFGASLALGGAGAAPRISGTVESPEGSYNELAFTDARARLSLAPPALRLDQGAIRVGSTHARFTTSLAPATFGFSVASRAANLADFDDYFDQSDLLAGTGRLAIAYENNGSTTQTAGNVDLDGLRIGRFPFGKTLANWSTRGRAVHASGAFTGPAGYGRVAGTVVPAAGDAIASLRGGFYGVQLHGEGIELGTWLPAAGLRYPVLGHVNADGSVSGRWPALSGAAAIELSGPGQVGPYPIASAALRAHTKGTQVVVDAADADAGFARLNGSGTIGIAAANALGLRVHATIPDLAAAAKRVAPREASDLGGSIDVDTVIGGTLLDPRITAGFDLENGRYGKFSIAHIIGNGRTDLHSIQLDSAEFAFDRGVATIAGSLPILLTPPAVGPAAAPLSLTLDVRGVDLTSFAPLLPGSGSKIGGTVDGRIAIEGTAGRPRVLGTATLANGSYVSPIETSPITKATAALSFEGTSVALQALHADVGGGALDASGRFNLPIPGAPDTGYTVAMTAKGAKLSSPTYGGGQIDGTAEIVSGARLPTLSGAVRLSNATIPFAAIFKASSPSETGAGAGSVFNLAFNLQADAGKNVRIKSPIIDVGATGGVVLTGTLAAPRLDGEFNATKGGIFSTYQRLFRIQDARVAFDPRQGIVPTIDLKATAHVTNPDPDTTRNSIGSADIIVNVLGPADAYTITYASDPPYSQDQIIGLLVDAPFLGAVNFNKVAPPGTLPGAPGESNVLLPPGVTPYQTGTYTIQQEAFSLLNTQLTQRLIAPLETAFGGILGLTDLQLTLDLGGRIGYTARQQLSRRRQVFVTLGQVLSYPVRTQVGLEARPSAFSSFQFTYYQQNGTPSYANSQFGSASTISVQNGIQSLSNRQGFRVTFTRTYP